MQREKYPTHYYKKQPSSAAVTTQMKMENPSNSNSSDRDTYSLPTLLCLESPFGFSEEEVDQEQADDDDDEYEYVRMLLDQELIVSSSAADQRPQYLLSQSRTEAIQYILSTNEEIGFELETAYLSVTYLDRFRSRRPIDGEKPWVVRLVAMACVSLAAKMEEISVPPLSYFPMEEYYFVSSLIMRMELVVSSTLNWRLKSPTPFAFINYFVSRLCTDTPLDDETIKSRISQVIMSIVEVVNLMSYKPSGIAAAATLMTLDPRLSREALELRLYGSTSLQPLNISIEDTWSCYKKLQDLEMKRPSNSSESIVSPLFSPTQQQNTNALDDTSSVPRVGSKRRRLDFDKCD